MEMGGQFHLDLGGQFAWIFQLEGLLLDENSNMHVFIKRIEISKQIYSFMVEPMA